ncbi:Hypothetical predicted protein [Mytilus galloprovincialis]|uniref:AIG1-type G domain-containing protein n=1 Tax=Mytilus galloprovincialis TaxID=29158 RepID=A0A8B6GTC3_MYTGA|nr:Hypothetical predicted protein [Mytilus galloprovincialis]
MASNRPKRIVLFGRTGVGKSSVGNTLLGKDYFKTKCTASSVTQVCETAEEILESGQPLQIVDTPGIFDAEGKNMFSEVQNVFDLLKPGPHAILIVYMPQRCSRVEDVLDLRKLFGNDMFLEYTILIINRKSEIINPSIPNVREFIKNSDSVELQQLYEQCGKRVVAVENYDVWEKRKLDAEEIMREIETLDVNYIHHCFDLVHENIELKAEQLKRQEQIRELERENKELKYKNNTSCNML